MISEEDLMAQKTNDDREESKSRTNLIWHKSFSAYQIRRRV
jgi:hypothetical protein